MKVRLAQRGAVWWVFASLPGDRQYRRSLGTRDRAEAIRRMVEVERQLRAGVRPEAGLRVAEWSERWLSDLRDRDRTPGTMRTYRRVMDQYVLPLVGLVRLDELTVADVERMDARLLQRGGRNGGRLGPSTVRQAHDALAAALHAAERESLLLRNVAALARRPERPGGEPRWLERNEALRLLDAAREHPWGAYAALAALTGLRAGELCGLRWEDIRDSSLHVQRQRRYDGPGTGFVDAAPKSRAGVRIVPLSDAAAAWIAAVATQQRERASLVGAEPPKHVFAHRGRGVSAGQWVPWTPQAAARGVGDLYRTAGLAVPARPIHTLRHTMGALMAEAKVDPRVRATLLGHSSVAQTYHYTHATDAATRSAVGEVGERLGDGNARSQDIQRGGVQDASR